MIPAMVLLLGIDQHTAEGTSLVAMLFTAAAGTRVNMTNRHVDWRAVWILGITGAVDRPAVGRARPAHPGRHPWSDFRSLRDLNAIQDPLEEPGGA